MKRILLITNIFPPDIGGPATFIPNLAQNLTEQGYRVTVVCTSASKTYETDRQFKFKLVRLRRDRNRIINELTIYTHLFKEILLSDVILCNGLEHQTSEICRLLSKPYILKVVGDTIWETARNTGLTSLDIDEFQIHSKDPSFLGKLSRRRHQYVTSAKGIITPSRYLENMVIGWGVNRNRITSIFNGFQFEANDFVPATRATGEPLRIIFVGRLTNWKGVESILISASKIDNIEINIVGDGPELPILSAFARQLGLLNKVHFLGKLSKNTVMSHLKSSHVLILNSLYEGLSHTLLEAGAYGLACIASSRGGNNEVISDGVNGFLVDPWNNQDLVERIITLRDNEELRIHLGKRLQRDIRHRFCFNDTVNRFAKLLTSTDKGAE